MSDALDSPTILIVDDDKKLAELLLKTVRREGFIAVTANSAIEAKEWLRGNRADLMLLDLKLPDTHGADLIDELAEEDLLLPFIIITGQGDEKVAVEMMKKGAFDYLVKDIQFLEMVPMVIRRTFAQLERDARLVKAELKRRTLQEEIIRISEQERQKFGRDLHDGLGQTLSGVDMLLEVLRKRLSLASPGDSDAVSAISGYVKDAIQQTRMLAQGLSPVGLQTNGLISSLETLAKDTTRLFKISCSFHCEKPIVVSDHDRATHLYRIAQEAINNAVKHGNAKFIEISLEEKMGRGVLSVKADGRGALSEHYHPGEGMGFRNMKYRAEVIGGVFEFRSREPSGSEVLCTFDAG